MYRATRSATMVLLHVVVSVLLSTASEASKVRPVNLEQMTERAATIFSGRCIELREQQDATVGGKVTLATFQVERAVKGAPGRTVTVKMLGGLDKASAPAGMPRFQQGEQLILFLYGESSLGLSSPVGLGQGKFSIYEDKQGRRVAFNETGNRLLFNELSPGAKSRLSPSLAQWKEGEGVEPAALLDMVELLEE